MRFSTIFSHHTNTLSPVSYVLFAAGQSERSILIAAICFNICRRASWATRERSASVVRGTIGPKKERRLRNSPKTDDDVTIPSGLGVSFVNFIARVSKTRLCILRWSTLSFQYVREVVYDIVLQFQGCYAIVLRCSQFLFTKCCEFSVSVPKLGSFINHDCVCKSGVDWKTTQIDWFPNWICWHFWEKASCRETSGFVDDVKHYFTLQVHDVDIRAVVKSSFLTTHSHSKRKGGFVILWQGSHRATMSSDCCSVLALTTSSLVLFSRMYRVSQKKDEK